MKNNKNIALLSLLLCGAIYGMLPSGQAGSASSRASPIRRTVDDKDKAQSAAKLISDNVTELLAIKEAEKQTFFGRTPYQTWDTAVKILHNAIPDKHPCPANLSVVSGVTQRAATLARRLSGGSYSTADSQTSPVTRRFSAALSPSLNLSETTSVLRPRRASLPTALLLRRLGAAIGCNALDPVEEADESIPFFQESISPTNECDFVITDFIQRVEGLQDYRDTDNVVFDLVYVCYGVAYTINNSPDITNNARNMTFGSIFYTAINELNKFIEAFREFQAIDKGEDNDQEKRNIYKRMTLSLVNMALVTSNPGLINAVKAFSIYGVYQMYEKDIPAATSQYTRGNFMTDLIKDDTAISALISKALKKRAAEAAPATREKERFPVRTPFSLSVFGSAFGGSESTWGNPAPSAPFPPPLPPPASKQ